jgi:glycosyltransferase involved in cell wall biosynthesis
MLRLSVILATYNRAETLRRTLAHLAAQTLDGRSFEVIVIDDASPDHTREVVAAAAKDMPCQVKYLTHSPNRGPGFTQNQGLREARAPLCLLIADDILMSPGALAAHLKGHRDHPGENIAILGDVLPAPDAQTTVFMRNFDPFRFGEFCSGMTDLPYYMFGACNISVDTGFMRSRGMFLEHRGRGGAAAHEDMELGFRLCKRGLKIRFEPAAWGHHLHIYTLESAARRMYERGLNWDEFRAHMPDPEFIVFTHLLSRHTLQDYLSVLRGPNALVGRERYLAWHVFRELKRRLFFNRITVGAIWAPLFEHAERSPLLARIVRPSLYRAFLYHHFERGLAFARKTYGRTRHTLPAYDETS